MVSWRRAPTVIITEFGVATVSKTLCSVGLHSRGRRQTNENENGSTQHLPRIEEIRETFQIESTTYLLCKYVCTICVLAPTGEGGGGHYACH